MLCQFQLNTKSKRQVMHKKMQLTIPQLTLAKIAQMGKYETVNTRSEHYNHRVKASIPVRGNSYAEFIWL